MEHLVETTDAVVESIQTFHEMIADSNAPSLETVKTLKVKLKCIIKKMYELGTEMNQRINEIINYQKANPDCSMEDLLNQWKSIDQYILQLSHFGELLHETVAQFKTDVEK